MRTQIDGTRDDYGRTEVTIDLTATLGRHLDNPAMVVQDDPGWLSGFPFTVGVHYFIPYEVTGEGLYSHSCDPVSEVVVEEVPDIVELAQQHGWTAARVESIADSSVDVRPSSSPAPSGDDGLALAPSKAPSRAALTPRLLGAVAFVLASGAVGLRHRRARI